MKNPFIVIGLSPTALEGLKIPQIKELLKQHKRTLSALHHPDKGGDGKRMVAINNAFEELSLPGSIATYRRSLLKKTSYQKRIEALELQIDELNLSIASMQKIPMQYADLLSGSIPGNTILNAEVTVSSIESIFSEIGYSRAIPPGKLYRYIIEDGEVSRKWLTRGKSSNDCIQVHKNEVCDHLQVIGVISIDSKEKKLSIGDVLGSLSETAKEGVLKLKGDTGAKVNSFVNRISKAKIEEYSRCISPIVSANTLLVGLNTHDNGDSYYTIEGLVMELSPV